MIDPDYKSRGKKQYFALLFPAVNPEKGFPNEIWISILFLSLPVCAAYIPEPVQVNPCYVGSHDCDTTAQCVPGEGQHFTCVCATGHTGDGRNCYGKEEGGGVFYIHSYICFKVRQNGHLSIRLSCFLCSSNKS